MSAYFNKSETEGEILQAYRHFLNYYTLPDQSIHQISAYLSPDMSCVVPEMGLCAMNYEATLKYLCQYKTQNPLPLFKETYRKITALSNQEGLVVSGFEVVMAESNTKSSKIKNQKISCLWEKNEHQWQIRHLHLSQEAYYASKATLQIPIKETQDDPSLRKQLNKRTRELCQLNIELSKTQKELQTLIKQQQEAEKNINSCKNEITHLTGELSRSLGELSDLRQDSWKNEIDTWQSKHNCLLRKLQSHLQKIPESTHDDNSPSPYHKGDSSLGMKVLLVDDKKVNLQVISLMLQAAGCQVDHAANGEEALRQFDASKHELILMDIMMPVMDGITAMKELRKEHTSPPPIIAITANTKPNDKEFYSREGFDGYIAKPVTMHKLTEQLREIGVDLSREKQCQP